MRRREGAEFPRHLPKGPLASITATRRREMKFIVILAAALTSAVLTVPTVAAEEGEVVALATIFDEAGARA